MNQILINEKIIVTPEFRRKRKIYKFNFFLSVFLACTLFSCCIYAEYDRNKSEQVSQEILLGLGEEDDTDTIDNTTISVEDNILIVKLLDNQEEDTEVNVSDLVQGNEERGQLTVVETVASDGTSYYTEATLNIPRLGIEYPVLSDCSKELLKISLTKYWGPAPNEVGNYVILGHNYKNGTMFGKLSKIEVGDTMELEDTSGRKITYKVYDRYVIEPTDLSCTSQLTDGKKEVTLVTCYNSGKQRLVVKAVEVQS